MDSPCKASPRILHGESRARFERSRGVVLSGERERERELGV